MTIATVANKAEKINPSSVSKKSKVIDKKEETPVIAQLKNCSIWSTSWRNLEAIAKLIPLLNQSYNTMPKNPLFFYETFNHFFITWSDNCCCFL
ncbi:hypothetical protein [Aphanothece hegewaldii]|uniref:hypothetical protein n=1 Tax=Aphanothece hegewaldii TaxID=1521625 RepID=UPI0015E79A1D|nr:hypothetical protein [Aphanothece hegewaldii]